MRSVRNTRCLLSLCTGISAGVLGASATAAVLTVPAQHPTIQAAINAASNGDFILVADGVHSGPGNYNIDMLGKAITLESMNGPANCIIDAQATQQTQRMVFYIHNNETNATVIQGFTIRGGVQFNGAGMLIVNSSPIVRNCVLTGNTANCWGGAIYYDHASPKFIDCTIVDNFSAADGGAAFGFEGSPLFDNCLIANNDGSFTAGAIFAWGSGSPKLMNCTVTGNHATWGSAIYSSNMVIENSIIWGNVGDQQIRTAGGNITLNVKHSNVQGGYAGVGNIDANPLFKNAASGDFHLDNGSLCIDAGNPGTKVFQGIVDLDGDPRVFGARIDMGVDEFRKTGDATGDHQVNIDDMVRVITNWGPCQINTADVNSDFMVNIDDLVLVITNWGM